MSFDEIFDIFDQLPDLDASADLHEIGTQNLPLDEIREQVLEAHKILVRLSEDNQQEFQDLIKALESGDWSTLFLSVYFAAYVVAVQNVQQISYSAHYVFFIFI